MALCGSGSHLDSLTLYSLPGDALEKSCCVQVEKKILDCLD